MKVGWGLVAVTELGHTRMVEERVYGKVFISTPEAVLGRVPSPWLSGDALVGCVLSRVV